MAMVWSPAPDRLHRAPRAHGRPDFSGRFRCIALLAAALGFGVPSSAPAEPLTPAASRSTASRQPGIQSADGIWVTPTTAPTRSAAIYDPVRDRMVLFGGFNGTTFVNEVWELTLSGSTTWVRVGVAGDAPSPRELSVAIYDSGNDRLLVFGGWNGVGQLDDLWELSLSGAPTWTRLTPPGAQPSPSGPITGIVDSARNRLLIFWDTGSTNSGIWALNLSGAPAWTPIAPTGPGPLGGITQPAAIYDASRDRMVLFGN